MNWYQKEIDEVFRNLGSSHDGISDAEAKIRLTTYGPNKLAEQEKISKVKILLHQFTSPLIYILLIASAVTFLLSEFVDTAVILSVVLFNALIGYFQEYKAEESVRALSKIVVPRARVFREGKEKKIESEEVVPGDVVVLSSGSSSAPISLAPIPPTSGTFPRL